MPFSAVDNEYEFNAEQWVVSLLNTGRGTIGKLGGHSMIVIEGIKRVNDGHFFSGQQFIGQYDISALPIEEINTALGSLPEQLCNIKGIISDIRVFESGEYHYSETYSARVVYAVASSKSHYIEPAAAQAIIDSIKQDKQQTDAARARSPWCYQDFLPYQSAGSERFDAKDEGANCVTWAERKLAAGGIEPNRRTLDSIKALPEKHVRFCVIL